MKRIALLAEHNPESPNHKATEEALRHSSRKLGIEFEHHWLMTSTLDPVSVRSFDGLWLTTGEYRNQDAVLDAVQIAREEGIPTLGTCSGFQHLILELARDVLGIEGVGHQEYNPDASSVIISQLSCSLRGREMTVSLVEGSRVQQLVGSMTITEQYYCNFGVNPDYVSRFLSSPVRIVGSDVAGVIRIIELPDHPFFIGTLFVPQARSTPASTHPLVDEFIRVIGGQRT